MQQSPDEIDTSISNLDDLDGLVLYDPLEEPEIPGELESVRFVPPWEQDDKPSS